MGDWLLAEQQIQQEGAAQLEEASEASFPASSIERARLGIKAGETTAKAHRFGGRAPFLRWVTTRIP